MHDGNLPETLTSMPSDNSMTDLFQLTGMQPATELSATEVSRASLPETMPVGRSTSEARRFRILRPHAKGGLGKVSIAFDQELNREVALKEIRDSLAQDDLARARFLTEA